MADDKAELQLTITLGEASFEAHGPAETVIGVFERFEKLIASDAPAAAKVEDQSKRARGAATTHSPGDKIPFAVFMKRQFPNQHAQATAILTWAKRYDGKDALKPGEIEGYWKKLTKKPGNISAVCINAEKEGWIEKAGSGTYTVIGHGENMVDGLPPTS